MGFLNNTTVTVDAILTKKGRELLAQGTEAFNITKFALADDEVDYNLWDVTHPNGSDYYGKVIENMPLLEAIPDENHVMRYKLVTLPKTTTKMPVLKVLGPDAITFDNQDSENQSQKVGAITNNVADSSYTFILHDQSIATMNVAQSATGAGAAAASISFFLGDDDVPNSKTIVGKSCNIGVVALSPTNTTARGKTTQLTIIGNTTGATKSITIQNLVVIASGLQG